MRKEKRYPFNMSKHQHDIFFRYNRCKNERDAKRLEGAWTIEEEERYEALILSLGELLEYGAGIVWLTGKEWALANESAAWAACMRK